MDFGVLLEKRSRAPEVVPSWTGSLVQFSTMRAHCKLRWTLTTSIIEPDIMQINFNNIEFNTYPWIAEDASDPERLLTLWENRCSKLYSCLEQWIPISSDCYILRNPWTYGWCRNLKDNKCMRGCLLDLPFMIWPEKWFCMGRVFEDTDVRVNGPVP